MQLREIIAQARSISASDVIELRSDYVSRFSAKSIDAISEQTLLPFRVLMSNSPLRLVSVEKVAEVVRRKIGRQIRFVPVSVEGMLCSVYGYVDNRADEPFVIFNSGMNMCWTRFTIVKELMHLYSGTATGFAQGGSTGGIALPMVAAAIESRRVKISEGVDFDDETVALLMALEVLVPWPLRNQLLLMREAGASLYQLAKAFLVPMNLIRLLINTDADRPISYVAFSNRINREL